MLSIVGCGEVIDSYEIGVGYTMPYMRSSITAALKVPKCDVIPMNFRLSQHAKEEMQRRAIPFDLLESVLKNPQQILPERNGRKVYQSIVDFGSGKLFLLRAVVADDNNHAVVITVYRTHKINKYWKP